jgi:nitroimidazol reductase NimA-like FMN-containing flavoprotein (pyridoxamine 5'-phosphate oxidase superfamily)
MEGAVARVMTDGERETFLADVHIGIVAMEDPGRSPLAVPVWYLYEPGGTVRIMTGRTSRKAELIGRSGQLGLVVQTETPPYKYVSIQGTATVLGTSDEVERRSLARRYLGREGGDAFVDGTAEADNVTIEIIPEVWRTFDYSESEA